MNIFRRMIYRVLRLPRTRGFGVQSPFAYRFVRNVVNGRCPDDAYRVAETVGLIAGRAQLKRYRLCSRLARDWQADQWCVCLSEAAIYAQYIHAGCPTTMVITRAPGAMEPDVADCRVLQMSLKDDWERLFDAFADTARHDSVLLLMDLGATKAARRAWRRVVNDERTGVTFDLADCGIVFFDQKMYKRNYKINY